MPTERQSGWGSFLRIEWQELGPVGRTVLSVLGMLLVAALGLAFTIPRQVEHHLVDSHSRSLHRVVSELEAEGIIPTGPEGVSPELDAAVRRHLLGADVVRVKVWLPDGTIGYSDEPALIGRSYPLSEDLAAAFAGTPVADVPDLNRPENRYERSLPPLREFYVPVGGDPARAVFEVYHLAEPIDSTVARVRSYVWITVGITIGLLALFVVITIVVNGRAVVKRQRLAERLFADLVEAHAAERARIVGALHDDIGQTLYRVHYGLEDLRSRTAPDEPSAAELAHLGELVAQVEGALRSELRSQLAEDVPELSIGSELDELSEVTEMETDLTVEVCVELPDPDALDAGCRALLLRSAREALTNVRKHAAASKVRIVLREEAGWVELEVIDDGVGFAGDEGLGLTTTRRRLEASGGELEIGREPAGGTSLVVRLPGHACRGGR